MRTTVALLCSVILAGALQAQDDAVDLLQRARSLAGEERYGEAIEVYSASLAKVEAELGLDSAAMAVLQKELAEQHRALGQLAEAEALYRRSLAIEEANIGAESLSVAVSLTEVAGLCERQGNLAEARELVARVRGILESECGAKEEKGSAARRSWPDDACPAVQRSHRELVDRLAAGGGGRVAPAGESIAEDLRVYRVQLASHHDRAMAERELARLQQAYQGLAALPGRVVSVAIGGKGVWNRIQFGEFAGAAEARRLCAGLREQGQECLVVSAP